jgi:hypothetical protein
MNLAFPAARVEGYQHRIPRMPNEAKDRHVAAAAAHAGCALIVTNNLRDFQPLPPGLAAVNPDEFLCVLHERFGDELISILEEQASALRNPPRTLDDVLKGLRSVVPRFVERAQSRLSARLHTPHPVLLLRSPVNHVPS